MGLMEQTPLLQPTSLRVEASVVEMVLLIRMPSNVIMGQGMLIAVLAPTDKLVALFVVQLAKAILEQPLIVEMELLIPRMENNVMTAPTMGNLEMLVLQLAF